MRNKSLSVIIAIATILTILSAGVASANVGSVLFTLKYKDPITGVESFLDNNYTYLHNASNPPPMEKFFSKADYVLQRSYPTTHKHNPTIEEGTYYIRITQRKNLADGKFGPPSAGDYTWFQTIPITIIAGKTLVLDPSKPFYYVSGVYNTTPNPPPLYTTAFGSTTISGTIKQIVNGSLTANPAVGRYVRAQTEPCFDDGYEGNVNQCGPSKYISIRPTDVDGKYTLFLRDPGTYFLYTSPCLTADWEDYSGNRCDYYYAGSVTVKAGDKITVNTYSY